MFEGLFVFFSRLAKGGKKTRLFLYSTALLIVMALLHFLILGPILSKAKSLDAKIQSQEARIKKSLHMLAQKGRIIKEKEIYASYVTPAGSQEEEAVLLLKEIEQIANESSVYVIDIKPAGLMQEDAFTKYLVRVNCEALMEQLTKFFYNVESSKKLLKIERYDIRPKTEGSSVVKCSVSVSKAVLP